MSQASTVPSFSRLYAFGDSLSDAGNLSLLTTATGATEPVSPPYYQASYTTDLGAVAANMFSNGPTWVQDVSLTLGLGTLAPSGLGGTDFAIGGAETGSTPQNGSEPNLTLISLPAQLAAFQASGQSHSATALYTLSIGANDVLDILNKPTLSAAQQSIDITDAVSNEIGFVTSLATLDGARNFLIMNVPDLGKTPDVTQGLANGSGVASAAADSLASSLAAQYNSDLSSQLATVAAAHSLDVHILDAYGLIDNAVSNPLNYGLLNVSAPVWTGNFTSAASGTLSSTVTAAQNLNLFFDHLHPTETGHKALAAAALTQLSAAAPCYAEGTRIATERGDVPVEHLCIGDRARLADGSTAAVVWLGHRRVDCRRHPRASDVQPVRIAAHAFGMGRPARDVLLSPDHAVYVEGALIPVRYLLNDATVRQQDVAAVTYWHVELPAHGVLLADGLPAESYLDTGNRPAFSENGTVVMAHPAFARATWHRNGCAPLVTAGPARDRAYRLLIAQALALGWRLADGRWIATPPDPAIARRARAAR